MAAVTKTVAELAELVGGTVIGDGSALIDKVSAIDEAKAGEITFLSNPRYQRFLGQCKASAVIVARSVALNVDSVPSTTVIQADDPYVAFAKILQLFNPIPRYESAIAESATVSEGAEIDASATIFPNVYISSGVKVGARSILFPGVFLGEHCSVGDDCVLHANVTVRHNCLVGNRVILHSGVVVGSDGFGYAGRGEDRVKIPQIGNVEISDDVEIGANSTIDRATLGRTIIGRGVKIDNLVQIAHNVVVGEHSVVAAQAGIAGSTRIGKNVTLAGQVGVVNHVQIGDGAMIGPQSGVAQSIPAGAVLSSGLPAAPHAQWLKVMALLPQLPKLWQAVRRLEKLAAEWNDKRPKKKVD